jgi:hypothetical protein
MARKKRWFGWVRRLFVSEQKPKAEKVDASRNLFVSLTEILHFFLVKFSA